MVQLLVAAYAALVVGGDLLGLLDPSAPMWASRAVTVALLVAVLVPTIREPKRPPAVPPALLAWAAMAIWCAASFAWSADPEATTRVGAHLGREALLVAALVLIPERRLVLSSIALGAVVGGLALALGLLAAVAMAEPTAGRLVVGVGDANFQGRQIALAAVFVVALGRRDAWGAALFLGLGLGLTGSRGAWLAALLGFAVAAWPGAARVRQILAAVLVTGTVIGALLLGGRPDVREPLPHADREALTSGRDAIWLNTLDIVMDHPLLGVGAGAVPAVYDPYRDARMAEGGLHSKRGRDPHSHYLQLLAETGPIGLGLFLIGLALAARGAPRHAGAVLVLAAVGATTVSSIEQKAFWLALAYAALAGWPRGGAPRGSPEEPVAP